MDQNQTEAVKTVVIIPAYEPPAEFIPYLEALSKEDIEEVCIVDDGSGQAFDPLFHAAAAIPRCHVIRYPENHGKGYALKTAFAYCKEHFSEDTVFVTADSDGQHTVVDVLRVAKEASEHPRALVLGSRDFNLPQVPLRSRMGNFWTRTFFRLVHGQKVYDTQTGLRGFSGNRLPFLLSVKGDRFEYEMNMLIDAGREKVKIREVKIETVYDETEHISHFQTGRDSALVMKSMFGSLGMYFVSSVISAVADVTIFMLLHTFLPAFFDFSIVLPLLAWEFVFRTVFSKVTARVSSSVINVYFNFRYVFHGKGKMAILRYYILWLCQLALSTGLVSLFIDILAFPRILSVIVIDLTLALLSYQVQRVWVFKRKDEEPAK